jgi:calcium/calmodulin-dependent protein kinase (CaM kinase) II
VLAGFGHAIDVGNGAVPVGSVTSLQYSAPELLKRGFYNEKIDIWSIGIVMFACLTGAFPFDCSNREEMIANIAAGLPDLLRQNSLANLSDEGKVMLRNLLHKDPARRLSADDALAHDWLREVHLEHDSASQEAGHPTSCSERQMSMI